MARQINPVATEYLPGFIPAPGQTDILFNVIVVFLLGVIFLLGVFYFKLHALPEHMAHRTDKVQLEIVAVLCLIALFTHNHLYWIAALLLAMIELPDFSTPLSSMAASLRRLAGLDERPPSPAAAVDDRGVEADHPSAIVRKLEVEGRKKPSHA
ncbi:hypothetical protein [Nordella sp. HKS 07]|uniref:hypothetical protein n=1 Tax=Nordella sp. HKS 07 TaxID=2712222 RepID=UPI001FEFDF1A|nr:hypothetical protein [Nordella sp. HKS 07]